MDLSGIFAFDPWCVDKAGWRKARLSGNALLGQHAATVDAVVFDTPQVWTRKKSGQDCKVVCILKCFTQGKGFFLAFSEFEGLFQVRNWASADGLMIAFYESPNLAFW